MVCGAACCLDASYAYRRHWQPHQRVLCIIRRAGAHGACEPDAIDRGNRRDGAAYAGCSPYMARMAYFSASLHRRARRLSSGTSCNAVLMNDTGVKEFTFQSRMARMSNSVLKMSLVDAKQLVKSSAHSGCPSCNLDASTKQTRATSCDFDSCSARFDSTRSKRFTAHATVSSSNLKSYASCMISEKTRKNSEMSSCWAGEGELHAEHFTPKSPQPPSHIHHE